MRVSSWLPLGSLALLAGWPACQPSRPSTNASAAAGSAATCSLTVLYQNNNNGEIEPCG